MYRRYNKKVHIQKYVDRLYENNRRGWEEGLRYGVKMNVLFFFTYIIPLYMYLVLTLYLRVTDEAKQNKIKRLNFLDIQHRISKSHLKQG